MAGGHVVSGDSYVVVRTESRVRISLLLYSDIGYLRDGLTHVNLASRLPSQITHGMVHCITFKLCAPEPRANGLR